MRSLVAALWVCLLALPAYAQPSAAQMERDKRRMDCMAQSGGVRAEERKKFVADCMNSAQPTPAMKKQQDLMRDCDRRAAAKGLRGDDRMKFMGDCVRHS